MFQSARLTDSISLRAGMLAVACLAAAALGHLLPFATASLVPFLFAPGIALAGLFLYGSRLWPGVAASSLLIALHGGAPLLASLAIATGNTLESLLAAHLLGRYRSGPNFHRQRDVLLLFATAALSPLAAAPAGAFSLSLSGIATGFSLPQTMLNWWVGDALHMLLITPLVLAVHAQRRTDWDSGRISEAAALITALSLAGLFTFSVGYQYFTKPFILFPFVLWGVLRFGMAGAAVTSFLITHLAAWGMTLGSGPFVVSHLPTAFSNATLWAFTTVISAASLIFAAMIEERREAEVQHIESEKNTYALLNAVTEIALLIDHRGLILACNQAAASWRNKAPGELIGDTLLALLPPDLRQRCQRKIDQVCRSGQPLRTTDRLDGSDFELSMFPVKDPGGEVTRLAVYAVDITSQTRREAFNALLQEIDLRVLQHEEQTPLLQFICDRIVRLFDFELAWIGRKEADGSVSIVAHAGESPDYHAMIQRSGTCWDCAPTCNAPVGIAIRQRRTVATATDGPLYKQWHEADGRRGPFMSLTIPLLVRGEVFGVMSLTSGHPGIFENAVIKHMLEQETAQRISVALEMAEDVHKLKLLGSALSAAANAVFITDQSGKFCWANQAFQRLSGYAPDEILGMTPRILNSGKQDEVYYRNLWATILSGKTWSDEAIERHKNGRLYTVQQTITPICNSEGRISHFISIHEDISTQKEAAAELERLAHYDLLTGLPNRTLFYSRLRETLALALRNEFKVALLFIDLNRFKQVNDTVGHHTGDLLLKDVALRLQDAVRETDTVARLGGDEFTVLLPTVKSRRDAALVAEKIISAFTRPFPIHPHSFEIGVSIGVTLFPDDTDQEALLLSYADMMMYEAKRHGKSAYQFFPEHGQF